MRRSSSACFDLLGEQALAADLGQEAGLHAIAGGADRHELDRARGGEAGMGGAKPVADQPGLVERHRAAAGADAKGLGRHECSCANMGLF